ncbi:Metallo-dependent hydrolase [Thozetella sp. PMI_491]|nr:Metallo-dependent hydrolase [Thozetella sp. PMI_491]
MPSNNKPEAWPFLHPIRKSCPLPSPATGLRLAILAIASCLLLGLSLHPPARRCLHRLGEVIDPRPTEDRVKQILTHTPLIDGHNDLPIVVRALYNNHIYEHGFSKGFEQGGLSGHIDLPRLRAGQNGGAFWSVYTTIKQIDLVAWLKQKYPHDLSPNLDSSSALDAFRKGQLISPLGIEEGSVRKAPPVWRGVSPEGRRLINEMSRLGVIVDLSHTSVDTTVDVLGDKEGWEGNKASVVYSHLSAYSIYPPPAQHSPDGIPDSYPPSSTLAHVSTHIIHLGNLLGFEHVGLWSNFDGIPSTIEGLDDVSKYPDLVDESPRSSAETSSVSSKTWTQ